ncbi:hypothetical protein HCN44_005336 [Aphidius gifuensis]|uniref:Myb-like domain-containing protein n=1 Tax=Aphidius gifuensis TaxID=684658 RepID=A0A834Y4J3_APHGI|nr:protein cramped [Aphidius gifuensis]KAF7997059.1 hypothetical protein HCN44_005336 [Aphidius gifuensis]
MELTKEEESQQSAHSSTKKDDTVGVTVPEVKTSDVKIPQAKVVRGNKRMRIDPGESSQTSDKKDGKDDDNDTKVNRALKRSCELWTQEDISTFFKAINEFGKDFDAVQTYFNIQGKKKGSQDNMIKNKEQIRHFYHRTWLKISKHLKFSDDVKKASQEIYGLINYGELRRKCLRVHEKELLKLNELIYWGSTQVRLRGKTIRIKTPICRALRKLNQLEDWQEEVKLPSRVTVELRPGNNSTWWQVQSNAMNPRVRTLLPIQRRLSSILIFLQQRWRPIKYQSWIETDIPEFKNFKDKRLLRVAPMIGCKIALPVVNLGEYLTSYSVSFNSYEKRLNLKTSKNELLGAVQHLKSVGKKSIKKKCEKKLVNRFIDDATNTDNNSDLDAIEQQNQNIEKNLYTNHFDNNITTETNRFPGRETIDRIKKGWNMDEANSITVGDLFLMFGKDSKIVLEYWWDDIKVDDSHTKTDDNNTGCILKDLLSIAKNYGSKAYDIPSSNETVVSSRIYSTKESAFRRPMIPTIYQKTNTQEAFQSQLDKFKTRFTKCGRQIKQRNLIVQRPSPLPSVPSPLPPPVPPVPLIQETIIPDNPVQLLNENYKEEDNKMQVDSNLPNDEIFMINLGTENANQSNSIITSASVTQILKEGEGQWLNSEVADYSLSSFLGTFESPIKGSPRSNAGSQVNDNQPSSSSSDVVSQMQCLMGESSVDYMAQFANLASQIASDE